MPVKMTPNGPWEVLEEAIRKLDGARVKLAQRTAVLREAHYFRKKTIEAFNTSGRSNNVTWPPNAPTVLARKRSSKPLIDTGDLRNSVQVVPKGAKIFVGVPNKVRTREGGRLASIAEVHEFGRTIAILITPAMHRYVMAMMAEHGSGSGGGSGNFKPGELLIIQIPERSFLRSTQEAHFGGVQYGQRVMARVAMILGAPWDQMVPVGTLP